MIFLDYLESTGTQYIDTGIHFNTNLGCEIKFAVTNLSPGYDFGIAGLRESISGTYYNFMPISKNNTNANFSIMQTDANSSIASINARTELHVIDYNNRASASGTPRGLWDGTSKGSLHTFTGESTGTIPLFARNWNGTIGVAHCQIHYAKFYNNTTTEIIKNFVPAIDDNGVPCMYETISGTCYYNQGTGSFTYNKIKYPITRVDFVSGNGMQYIDTEYKPNTNTKVELKFNLLKTDSTIDYERILESFKWSTAYFSLKRSNTATTWAYALNNSGKASVTLLQGVDYTLTLTNSSIKVNDTEYTFTATTFTSNYPIQIFHGNDRYGKLKLYYMKIWDNGVLVRNFIPTIYNGNVPCLYDLVHSRCYFSKWLADLTTENESLITDRVQADTTGIAKDSLLVSKGAYNYTDLNRVESKVKELNSLLIRYNYMTQSLTTKLDWTMSDKFNQNDSTRYLNNVSKVRQALTMPTTTPSVPSTMNQLTYQQANDIEKILQDIEGLVNGLSGYFVYSGVSNSGQRRLYQNRFRHLPLFRKEIKKITGVENLSEARMWSAIATIGNYLLVARWSK